MNAVTLALFVSLILARPVVPPPKAWHCGEPDASSRCETRAEQEERLAEIAADALSVAGSPDEALLILAVAEHESGFAIDVDKGPCREGTCDSGAAFCMLQVHADREHGAELFKDRRMCFREGLTALRRSRGQCRKEPAPFQFSAYASGTCEAGHKGSAELYSAWVAWGGRYRAEKARREEKKP